MLIFPIISMGDIMKKLLLLFSALFLLCSCAPETPAPEPYLRCPMTVEAHLQNDAGNARVIIDYKDTEHYTVRYTEPEVMTGITYEYEDGKAYMSFGESRIPVTTGEACFASLAIGRFICPEEGTEITEGKDALGEEQVTVKKCIGDDGTVNIYIGNDGLPLKAEGKIGGFSATLSEIKIEYDSQG